jgi:hypothetical protein
MSWYKRSPLFTSDPCQVIDFHHRKADVSVGYVVKESMGKQIEETIKINYMDQIDYKNKAQNEIIS